MRNLIRKILKESDEYDWVKDNFDTSDVENEMKKKFLELENDFSFDPDLYDRIIDAGANDVLKIKSLGQFIYDEVESIQERAYDDGREAGYDDCSCEGCCDDYVWYEDARRDKEEAEEEGYERGREESETEIEELKDEIQELKDKIEELENQLNENINQKNIKRI
jgi:flagellar biosynthesis/type III secretory pathway protein FliH